MIAHVHAGQDAMTAVNIFVFWMLVLLTGQPTLDRALPHLQRPAETPISYEQLIWDIDHFSTRKEAQ